MQRENTRQTEQKEHKVKKQEEEKEHEIDYNCECMYIIYT